MSVSIMQLYNSYMHAVSYNLDMYSTSDFHSYGVTPDPPVLFQNVLHLFLL